ncbi:MAG: Crp/Fnr family transcriptional regulator [Ignavibacteriales bacterium]|nr:Crp/Fnr family transcriptional regulator [Ignavibacteriales bacterium]
MADKTKFWYLKHFNMFDGMDESSMKRVDSMSSMQTVKTHQPIYFPDEPTHRMFFLKQGHVKISRVTQDGKEVILDVLGPGEIFGEMRLPDEDAGGRNEMAEALDEAIVCTMKREDFESLLKMNPNLNLEVTKRVGLRLRKIEERVTDLLFKDTRKRIASFLVRYAEEFGKMKQGIVTVGNPLTQQEIALLTGSARQTVTSTLNEFRSMGILDFSRSTIIIKDFGKLKRISE